MIYLDLEETIIQSWENQTMINSAKIKRYLKSIKCTEIGIYSFAIHNDTDLKEFNVHLKEIIETFLDVKIVNVLTIPEIMRRIKLYENIQYDSMYDFIQMNGKYFSFHKFCLTSHPGEFNTLIDDCVPNSITNYTNPDLVVKTINVNNL